MEEYEASVVAYPHAEEARKRQDYRSNELQFDEMRRREDGVVNVDAFFAILEIPLCKYF